MHIILQVPIGMLSMQGTTQSVAYGVCGVAKC